MSIKTTPIGLLTYLLCIAPIVLLFTPKASVFFLVALSLPAVFWGVKHAALLKNCWADSPFKIWCPAAIGLMLLSATWSILPEESIKQAFRLILLFGVTFFMMAYIQQHARAQSALVWPIMLGCCVAMAVFIIDVLADGFFMTQLREITGNDLKHHWAVHYNRGILILAGFSLLVAAFLIQAGKYWAGALLLCVMSTIAAYSESQTACFALILSLISAAFIYLIPKRIARALVMLSAMAYFIFFPKLLTHPESTLCDIFPRIEGAASEARLHIWAYSMQHFIYEKPLLGHGIGLSSQLGKYESDADRITACDPKIIVEERIHHAHNAVVQSFVELGAIGYLFYGWFGFLLLRQLPFGTRNIAESLAGSAIIYVLAVQQVGYGLWQSWFISFIILALCLAKLVSAADKSDA